MDGGLAPVEKILSVKCVKLLDKTPLPGTTLLLSLGLAVGIFVEEPTEW